MIIFQLFQLYWIVEMVEMVEIIISLIFHKIQMVIHYTMNYINVYEYIF